MRNLIFLLFFVFALSNPIKKGLINRNACLGGKIVKGNCTCPDKTALIGHVCKPCIGGEIISNRCKCPFRYYLSGNECIRRPLFSPYTIIRNGTTRVIYPRKPVIYLYPKETQDISVQLNVKNTKFTTIYPKFNERIHGMLELNQMEIF